MKSFCNQPIQTTQSLNESKAPEKRYYALRRGVGFWEVIFEGRQAIFKHEQGALYVACLLLDPPGEPLHAVALALKARDMANGMAGAADLVQQRNLGLDDAQAIRNLRRRERELEAVLDDDRESEPVKAEALRELEQIAEFLRRNPWRIRDQASKCAEAVSRAIRRLHNHLHRAEGAPVLWDFARHLHDYLLIPSHRGPRGGSAGPASIPAGCFTYEPPTGVVWVNADGLSSL